MIDDGAGMANAMNSFFVNIGSSVEAKIPKGNRSFSSYLGVQNGSELEIGEITINEVLEIITSTCIINKSLREGIFPALIESARVCPIFKKGDKCRCENYRPISLLSNLSKIFERVFYNKLKHFLNEFEIIYKLQFGFRKKYSTNHALLSIIEQIRHYLDNGTFACGVFVDLEKAL